MVGINLFSLIQAFCKVAQHEKSSRHPQDAVMTDLKTWGISAGTNIATVVVYDGSIIDEVPVEKPTVYLPRF
jgi:hypothetical protein